VRRSDIPDVTMLRPDTAGAWLVFLVFAALSVALGFAIASGPTARVSVAALLPVLIVVAAALIASNRAILIFGALALDLTGYIPLRNPVIGGHIFAADLIVLLALGTWVAAWLIAPTGRRPSWPKTLLLGWPLLIFAIFIGSGVVRGHQLWGESFVSQPVRFVIYALIAAAIADLKPRQAWQGIVTVFYLGAVWNAVAAAYYIATGTWQQDNSAAVSTGGHRVLTLTTGLYLTGALLVALLELEREHRAGRRMLHVLVGALAVFGILVSYGRGVFLSTAGVIIVLVLTRPRLRKGALAVAPFCIPLIVLAGLILTRTDPSFVPGIVHRALALNSSDPSIQWRQGAVAAIWAQVRENPIFGVGFGKGASFTVNFARFNITQDPHDSYLFLWAGGGILALGSFLFLFLIFIRDSWRRYRLQSDIPQVLIVWCVSFWACIALNTLVEPQLTQPNSLLVLWILMLLPTIVPYAKTDRGNALVA
jgi:O-antigen ligase